MELNKKTERVPQLSPEAERMIQNRQHSPICLKVAALVQQEDFNYGRSSSYDEAEQSSERKGGLIDYLTRLFITSDE